MNYNALSVFPSQVLAQASMLSKISLLDNFIRTADAPIFSKQDFPALVSLDLSYNPLDPSVRKHLREAFGDLLKIDGNS